MTAGNFRKALDDSLAAKKLEPGNLKVEATYCGQELFGQGLFGQGLLGETACTHGLR
jgi:hypothetical protein